MKHSIYNFIEKNNHFYLIYNLLQSTCVILNDQEYQQFQSFSTDEKTTNTLLKLGMYVEDNIQEEDIVHFRSKRASVFNNVQFYRIYSSLACNAKCPYCYEKGVAFTHMTIQTAQSVCRFIMQNVKPNSTLLVEWFGGEPLINMPIIDYVSKRLKTACRKKNIVFKANMVSNGFLFDEKVVKKAVNVWNLTRVQITLDGLKETYEKIKGFAEKNAFEKVLRNIKILLDANVFVSIRLNYDENNLNEILQLITFLGKNFAKYKNLYVYAKKIMAPELDNSLTASEDLDIVILKQLLKNKLIKNVLNTIPTRFNACIAKQVDSFVILPNGDVGKCSQALNDGDVVGNIVGGINENKIARWCNPNLPEKCNHCKLLPMCYGGCAYEYFLHKNFCFASEKTLRFKLQYYLEQYVKKHN